MKKSNSKIPVKDTLSAPLHSHNDNQVFINFRGEELRCSFVSHLVDFEDGSDYILKKVRRVTLVKKRADKRKLQVIPVFFKVKAASVRYQKAEFGRNFWRLAKASSGEQIKKWKEALESVSDKMGLSLCDKRYLTDLPYKNGFQVSSSFSLLLPL
ncbi:hypothetical protein HID58_064417 [Brassica napus]|uniref:TIR domain-containing protein n=1 Tax=Brassica napus TaxID=3708 RepID=A0ABQ7ZA07_BRANA|nr:hypothetical protein HID58_064417 [Brassica napus]